MIDRKHALSTGLLQAHATLDAVLDQLTPSQWESPIQEADARWTTRQLLSHLCDAARGQAGQITRIVAGEETVPPDFDLNRWNKRTVEKANDRSVAELRQTLADNHALVAKTLAAVSDADLDKVGRHSSLNMMIVETIFRLIGTHEIVHAKDIAQVFGLPFAEPV